MRIKEKINLKRYTAFSLALLAVSYGVCSGPKEYLIIALVFIAVILNQWMLLSVVDSLIENAIQNEAKNTGNIIFSFLFKSIILIMAISFGVHIMGNRIIIPVIIYVAQIFVLYFSLKVPKEKRDEFL